MSEMAANPSLKRTALDAVAEARKRPKLPPWTSEAFAVNTLTGFTIRRKMIFQKKSDFVAQHGLDPSLIGLACDELTDERGDVMQGILFADPAAERQDKGIEVELFHTKVSELTSLLQPEAAQIRAGQASDFAAVFKADQHRVEPKSFKSQHTVSLSDVPAKIEEYRQAQERKREQEQAIATLVPAATSEVAGAPPASVEDESSEEGDAQGDVAAGRHLLPSTQSKRGKFGKKIVAKAAAKTKSAAKIKTGAGSAGAGGAHAHAGRGDMPPPSLGRYAAGDSASARSRSPQSVRSTSGKRLSPQEKAQMYVQDGVLPVTSILENSKKYGAKVWQAQETLSALERAGSGHIPDAVTLRAHLNVAVKAQERIEAPK